MNEEFKREVATKEAKTTWGIIAFVSILASIVFFSLQVFLIREYETIVPLLGLSVLLAILSIVFSFVQIKHKKPLAFIIIATGCIVGTVSFIGILDYFGFV